MMNNFPTIYIFPPILSLIVGITLATISIVKGKLKPENIFFALICLWWTLLSPVFISHHLLISKDKIIAFERIIHFFYVFLPVIHLLFIHKILGIKRNYLVIIGIIFSLLLSMTTFTEYYIQGLYQYSWGYIAKGGIAFQLFGLYGGVVLLYMLYCLFDNLKREKNRITRLSNSYMLLSFAVLGVLTILNLPAINGFDLYPAGNFSFIPLSVLAYGVLRYRLLDIKSFLHITVFRIFSLVVFLLPNWAIYYYARPLFSKIDGVLLYILFMLWFLANHLYLVKVQTKLDNKFYRMKFRLKLAEIEFIEKITPIAEYDSLIYKIRSALKNTLALDIVSVFQKIDNIGTFMGPLGYQFRVGTEIEKLLFHTNHFVDRKTIKTHSHYAPFREKLLKAFSLLQSAYMIPLFRNDKLIALFFLSESSAYRISKDEINFANNILASASEKLSELTVETFNRK